MERSRRFDLRFEAWAIVELVTLSGFAIAQPLLDVFGDAPEVFVFHRADAADIVAFAAFLVLAPPLTLWAGGVIIGAVAGARARRVAHHLTLAALAGLFAIRVLRDGTPLSGLVLGAVVVVIGALAYTLFPRRAAQLWMRFAGPAPVAFAALFLFSSNVAPLVTDSAGGLDAVAGVEANGTPVVVLVFDELPTASLIGADGAIDADRFPNFARLAADSTWFRNATGVADYTQRAVPPALTGRYPPMTAASANWRDHPDNLFRLLGGAYDTHIIESLTVLCPPTVCDGDHDVDVPSEGDGDTAADAPAAADDGLVSVLREARRVYGDLVALDEPDTNAVATLAEEIADVPDDPDGPDSSGEQPTSTTATIAPLPGDDVDPGLGNIEFDPDERTRVQPRRAVEFLDSLHEQPADADPGFWFLHLVLPHNPFHLLPDGGRYAIPGEAEATPGLSGQLEWDDDPWPALAARQRHLLQLRAVDDFVGDVLDELERFDLYDRALVVATADHGASFDAATNFRSISPATASDIAWVPFFVKQPDNVAGGTIDDRNVEIVDLLPTVADVLDIDVPWPVDGRSVFGPARTNATKTFRSAPLFPRDDEDFVELTLDGRAGLRQMLASALVADQAAAGGDVDLAILRTGPYGDLVGQRLDQFDVRSPDARRRAAVDRADAFAAVDLDDELPLFVRGRLDGATGDETVVVALNGTIAGISSVFDDRREPARFTVLIPERLVRSGANELAVYLLDEEEPEGSEGGRGIALTPLELG